MKKTKEFIEGYISALKAYSWLDNVGVLRVGITGILLSDALAKAESEIEPEEAEVAPKEAEVAEKVTVTAEKKPLKHDRHKKGR